MELHRRWWALHDQHAVSELWRRHQRVAVHVASRLLHTSPDAAPLALGVCDEAFVKALRTFQPGRAAATDRPFRAWFLHLTRSAAIDLARRRRVQTEPETETAVWHDPSEQLVTQQQLASARAWVLQHFLPSDWTAIELSAEGWSWQDIAQRSQVTLPEEIAFQSGSEELTQRRDLVVVQRTLQMCPRLVLRVIGTQMPSGRDARPGLGLLRAKVVAEVLCGPTPSLARRLEALGTEDRGEPRVRFEVVSGGLRTAAAQRVRVQTILERYRAVGER